LRILLGFDQAAQIMPSLPLLFYPSPRRGEGRVRELFGEYFLQRLGRVMIAEAGQQVVKGLKIYFAHILFFVLFQSFQVDPNGEF
jgi:hypothetical protein